MLDTGEFGRTHVLTAGKAGMPDLVLLHGTSANSAAWFGFLPHWNEHFRIYALDIPGEPGLSDERRPHLAGGGLTRWFGRAVAALGLERFHLAGMSLGGWLSLDWGVHQPQTCTVHGAAHGRRTGALPSLLLPQMSAILFPGRERCTEDIRDSSWKCTGGPEGR